ncbi:MAG TPA: hypothetical protein VHL80_03155, partial [Polyangia bacterium]|nr:hypothetical protein [Polyangia bacterium]
PPSSPAPAPTPRTSVPAPSAPDAGAGAGVGVQWSFPALIPDAARGLVFPTYMAHLLGHPLDHPFPTDLACVDVDNPGSPFSATLTVEMAIYGEDAAQDLAVPSGHSRHCLTPAFDLAKLYALRAATPGRLEASLSSGGAVLGATMQPLSISPVDEIAWQDGAIAFDDMRALATVFVTPGDPKIDQLQRLAASQSVFGRFGNGADPYERDPWLRSSDLDAQTWASELVVVEAGEPIAWSLASVSGGDDVVDVYLFTPDQFDAWREGDARDAAEVWADQTSGASAQVSETPGAYVLVVFNTQTYPTVSVSWSRNVTREDVAQDALGSIYTALRSLHTQYSDVSSSFFDGFQHVRRPSEALDALSANCLEGSLLFASVLELVGMRPVLVFKTGHAYVGVASAPGSSVLWPVETTMIGTNEFPDAFGKGLDELDADSQDDPGFELVDVAAARAHGILPLAE